MKSTDARLWRANTRKETFTQAVRLNGFIPYSVNLEASVSEEDDPLKPPPLIMGALPRLHSSLMPRAEWGPTRVSGRLSPASLCP